MKKVYLALVLMLVINISAIAQDKTADIKKLVKLTNSETMINEFMGNYVESFKKQAYARYSEASSKKKIDEIAKFIADETKKISRKVIDVDAVKVYDKNFTPSEIKDLIKFYESPTGKKLLKVTPELSKAIMEPMMSKYLPDLQEKIKNKVKDLK